MQLGLLSQTVHCLGAAHPYTALPLHAYALQPRLSLDSGRSLQFPFVVLPSSSAQWNAYRACNGKEVFFLVFGLGINGPQDEWDKGGLYGARGVW